MDHHLIAIIGTIALLSFSGVLINMIKNVQGKQVIVMNDGGSLLLFRLIIPFSIIAAFCAYYFLWGNLQFTIYCTTAGFLMVAIGLLIRWIAVLSLGPAFTVQLAIVMDHHLKTDGIYKNIRHPSYTGLLLYYLGLGIAMHNWVSIVLLVAGPLGVVMNRITMEEAVLKKHFGKAYEEYMKRTKNLIPGVF
jgi:protein-S-isoprenylcysteine O-methyltransferase Ste14